MLNRLKSLVSRSGGGGTSKAPLVDGLVVEQPALSPERPVIAIGDLHGCDTAFEALLARIDAARAEDPALAGAALVLLGDLVDRGPDSRKVLEKVRTMVDAAPEDIVCLTGNHELMMLDFIDDPLGRGLRWLAFGGAETLQSFGIKPVSHKADPDAVMDTADTLDEALGAEGLQGWLRDLPDRWATGNIACVHAAMAPDRSFDKQSRRHLCWGASEFMTTPREDGLWVVHGHTITQEPSCIDGRVAVDTGAYRSGRLTAAAISQGQCRFLQV